MLRRYIQNLIVVPLSLMAFSAGHAAEPYAYTVNTLGESLSRINLTTGLVQNNIVALGSDFDSAPNQIIIRDTLAYCVNSGTDEIQIINLNSNQTVRFISTGPNSNPYWMVFYDSQYVFVSLILENQIARVDVINGTVTKFPTGKSPAGLAIFDHKLFVACSGFDFATYEYDPAFVRVYDIATNDLLATIPAGINCQFLAVDRQNRIHAVATGDYFTIWGKVYVMDGDSHQLIDSIVTGGSPGQICISPLDVAYLAAGGWTKDGLVYTYNALTGEVYHDDTGPLEVDQNCLAVATYQDSTIFAGSFSDYINAIDSSGAIIDRYTVGDGPVHLDFNYLPGDIDGDFDVNILDILYYIDYKFKGGADIRYPRWRANVNGDYLYNIVDIIYMVNYKFKNGPRPKTGAIWLEPFPAE